MPLGDAPPSAGLTLPREFRYEPSKRDPFIDAGVKTTLQSKTTTPPEAAKSAARKQFEGRLREEILFRYKINGVVCNKAGGAVLIENRILRPGDGLDLPLQEQTLKELSELDNAQNLGWRDTLKDGSLSFGVEWITASGIGVSCSQLDAPISIPFRKRPPIQEASPNSHP